MWVAAGMLHTCVAVEHRFKERLIGNGVLCWGSNKENQVKNF